MASPTPLIGIALNPRSPASEDTFFEAIRMGIRCGQNGLVVSAKWADIEPKPGNYELKPIQDNEGIAKLMGAKIALTIQTIDTNQRTLPADLAKEPWASPKMLERWRALVRAVTAQGRSVSRLSLGNEVDVYLRNHPGETQPYLEFLTAGREAAKAVRSDMLVGVTCTFSGVEPTPQLVRAYNQGMDVTFLTYYPLAPDFNVRPVAEVGPDFQKLVSWIPNRPIVLQEVGYPAAESLGSSKQRQAEFVRAAFRSLREHSDRIALASFFLLHDFPDSTLDQLETYYGIRHPSFRAFLGTLGLRTADGAPRPAWEAFTSETRRMGL